MDKTEIADVVKKAMREEMQDFYIERETHYRHHQFLGEFMQWTEDCKKTIFQTITRIICYSVIGFLILGFIVWGAKNFK